MKTIDKVLVVVVVIFVVAALIYLPAASRSMRRTEFVYAKNLLYEGLKQEGSITNRPNRPRLFVFTNQYAIAGSNYSCVLAVDSWDHQNASNLLAITTNEALVLIDEKGVVAISRRGFPRGF